MYNDVVEVTVEGFLVCKTRTDDGEVVNVDDDLVAMMSGGVLNVDTKMMETRP